MIMITTINYCVRGLAMLIVGLSIASLTSAATTLPGLPDAGWAVWQADAVPGAPRWCCRKEYRGPETACRLDDKKTDYHHSGPDGRTTQAIRIYVHMDRGRPRTIRTLAADCPVTSTGGIVELGAVDAADSVAWMQQQIDAAGPPADAAIAALAMHAGTAARDALIAVAGRVRPAEHRRNAVFWMGQVRPHDSADVLARLMFEDADPELRAHAAFSLSQSNIPGRFASLERLATTDSSGRVRARAWFWLVQIEAPGIEAAIRARLAEEPDAEAREQMVFALSQLPTQRALAALSDLIEDPALERRVRKQAIFWLAQNESPEALERIEELLAVSKR